MKVHLELATAMHYKAFTPKEQLAFDKWFGKSVVKKDGNPIIVYHGTPSFFDAFDEKRLGHGNDEHGIGFYFTDNPKWASDYAGKGVVKPSYIRITKPIFWEKQPRATRTQLGKILWGLGAGHAKTFISENYDLGFTPFRVAVEEYLESMVGTDLVKASFAIYQDVYDGHPNAYMFAKVFKEATGYDGIIVKRGDHFFYVVFSPLQIKSALGNKGTFKRNSKLSE